MRTSLTGPEPPAPAAIPLSLHPQGPAPPNGDAFLDPQPLSEARCCQGHPGTFGQTGKETTRPALERATMALTIPSGHPALGSSETVVVSATTAAAASR